jgi:hypothetical protein
VLDDAVLSMRKAATHMRRLAADLDAGRVTSQDGARARAETLREHARRLDAAAERAHAEGRRLHPEVGDQYR